MLYVSENLLMLQQNFGRAIEDWKKDIAIYNFLNFMLCFLLKALLVLRSLRVRVGLFYLKYGTNFMCVPFVKKFTC